MREISHLDPRYTEFMYLFADYTQEQVDAPDDISDFYFNDILEDENINDVYERVAKPCKRTLLHSFIANLLNGSHQYIIKKAAELECDRFSRLISHVELQAPPWLNEDEVGDHKEELRKLCHAAITRITPTVFHLLFSDRNFLFKFQQRVATYIRTPEFQQHPQFLLNDGVVKRISRQPSWLKRAVFFRDQGRCQLCSGEISGLNSPNISVHLDHMVPLAAGGSNDPTNFQLTCDHCNTSKGKKVIVAPARFEPYW